MLFYRRFENEDILYHFLKGYNVNLAINIVYIKIVKNKMVLPSY